MNCSKCNALNPDSARFCSQCGSGLYYSTPAKPTVTPGRDGIVLLLLLAWEMGIRPLIWMFVDKVLVKMWEKTGSGLEGALRISKFYNGFTLCLDVVTFILLVIAIIMSRNTLQRIVLAVFIAILFLLTIVYRILPLFDKPEFQNF